DSFGARHPETKAPRHHCSRGCTLIAPDHRPPGPENCLTRPCDPDWPRSQGAFQLVISADRSPKGAQVHRGGVGYLEPLLRRDRITVLPAVLLPGPPDRVFGFGIRVARAAGAAWAPVLSAHGRVIAAGHTEQLLHHFRRRFP